MNSEYSAPAHRVQFYDAHPNMLAASLARYAGERLEQDGCAVIVATPAHQKAVQEKMRALHIDPQTFIRNDRLIMLDAAETLTRFMVDGYPDADRFERQIGTIIRVQAAKSTQHPLRVYGEMVGLLWETRQFPAALRLEQLWSRLLKRTRFELFCGYPLNIFSPEFQQDIVDTLLCAHTHVQSGGEDGALEGAIDRALREVLGMPAAAIDPFPEAALRQEAPRLPRGEALILWLRKSALKGADEVLARAEKYYFASA